MLTAYQFALSSSQYPGITKQSQASCTDLSQVLKEYGVHNFCPCSAIPEPPTDIFLHHKVRHFRDRSAGRQHFVQVGQRVLRQPPHVDGQGLGLSVREKDRRRPGHEYQNVGAPCH